MSENIRQQDEGVVSWLRRLSARIDRLEKGDKGVRVNDTRLGDLVLKSNTKTSQIEATNLKTGDMTPITSFRETVFSWPGLVSGGGGDTPLFYDTSPPEVLPDSTVAHELVISVSDTAELAGSVAVAFVFPGLRIVSGLNLDNGDRVKVRPINVPVYKNDRLWVYLYCSSGVIYNLSATIRYGEPYEGADNFTVDLAGCEFPE